jgi:hypothetical protein
MTHEDAMSDYEGGATATDFDLRDQLVKRNGGGDG